ncbi:MAG: hypothetical protein GX240_05600 [Candidatus Atribacteria bacterium]|jgi:hypothetical protein|nr:hypothetical protein [Candidatus Atribacteria bacterium]
MVVAKTYYDHMITTGSFGGKIDPALKSEERFTDNFSADDIDYFLISC